MNHGHPSKTLSLALAVALGAGLGAPAAQAAPSAAPAHVTRATLANGLRVVVVHDSLAPVVTTEMNYLVGADEVAKGFPGSAHAMEHMMFRGSPGLGKDQLLAIASNLGGNFNADTQHGVTQYYFTVPSQDLGVALHIAALRMRGVDVTEAGWKKERGAIEQEVSRDHSNPIYKFLLQMNQQLFADTPYQWQGLGTRASFDKTTAARLKKFHDTWYAPNNAILVIAGDVDPQATLAKVRSLFADIPSKPLPARPSFSFQPTQAQTIQLPTDLPVGLVATVWRAPGLRDKDYATALVLAQALGSKRGKLYAMGLTGKALYGGFGANFMPHAGFAIAQATFPRGGDPHKVLKTMNAIVADAAEHGVPADLVQAAKQKTIAGLEYKKNSVAGLANAWSSALANSQLQSPDDLRTAIAAVTPSQVNALAKRLLDPQHALTAILTPQSSGKPISHSRFGGAESFGGKPDGAVTLPDWAEAAFAKLTLPASTVHPTAFTLDNGLRLIVQPESVSDTVEVFGRIKTNPDLQAAKGKEGVAGLLDRLFAFGATDLPRLPFQAALDAISAEESAGTSFSLSVPAAHFAEGVKLLADNELHPAMPARAFQVMQHNQAGAQAGNIQSPGFLNWLADDKALLPPNDPALRYATPATIGSLHLADVKAYYGRVFRPDLTTIVVIGKVAPETARQVIVAQFGSWKAAGPKPEVDYPAVPLNRPSQFHTPDSSAVQDSVTLTELIAMTEDSPDRYALFLGNTVLGGGGDFGTRLMHDLRVKAGLVYGVSSSSSLDKHRGRFTVSYGCDPDKVAQARQLVLRDIGQMQHTPVSAKALHDAKGKMLRGLQLDDASFGSIAGTLLSYSLQGKPLNSNEIAAHHYYSMNADTIQAAFRKYLRPDAFVTAVKGPAPKG